MSCVVPERTETPMSCVVPEDDLDADELRGARQDQDVDERCDIREVQDTDAAVCDRPRKDHCRSEAGSQSLMGQLGARPSY